MNRLVLKILYVVCLACMLGSPVSAEEDPANHSLIADRRKEQFTKDSGYALFPYPYGLPGIGSCSAEISHSAKRDLNRRSSSGIPGSYRPAIPGRERFSAPPP